MEYAIGGVIGFALGVAFAFGWAALGWFRMHSQIPE